MNWYVKISQNQNNIYRFRVPSEEIAQSIAEKGKTSGFEYVESIEDSVSVDVIKVLEAYLEDKEKYRDFLDILFRYNKNLYTLTYSIEQKAKRFSRTKKRTRKEILNFLSRSIGQSVNSLLSNTSSFLQGI